MNYIYLFLCTYYTKKVMKPFCRLCKWIQNTQKTRYVICLMYICNIRSSLIFKWCRFLRFRCSKLNHHDDIYKASTKNLDFNRIDHINDVLYFIIVIIINNNQIYIFWIFTVGKRLRSTLTSPIADMYMGDRRSRSSMWWANWRDFSFWGWSKLSFPASLCALL